MEFKDPITLYSIVFKTDYSALVIYFFIHYLQVMVILQYTENVSKKLQRYISHNLVTTHSMYNSWWSWSAVLEMKVPSHLWLLFCLCIVPSVDSVITSSNLEVLLPDVGISESNSFCFWDLENVSFCLFHVFILSSTISLCIFKSEVQVSPGHSNIEHFLHHTEAVSCQYCIFAVRVTQDQLGNAGY